MTIKWHLGEALFGYFLAITSIFRFPASRKTFKSFFNFKLIQNSKIFSYFLLFNFYFIIIIYIRQHLREKNPKIQQPKIKKKRKEIEK